MFVSQPRDCDRSRCRCRIDESAEPLCEPGDPAGALGRLEETERAAPEETGPEERWRLDFALTRAFAALARGADARLRGREARRQLDRIADPLEETHRRSFEGLREVAAARERLAFLDLAPQQQDGGDGGILRQILDLNARMATETDPDRMFRTILDIAIGTTGAERGFVLTPVLGQGKKSVRVPWSPVSGRWRGRGARSAASTGRPPGEWGRHALRRQRWQRHRRAGGLCTNTRHGDSVRRMEDSV